jgi:nucleotide-binding universal stress UspA family protein
MLSMERPFRKIVLSVDSPANSGPAVELATKLAQASGAELLILHVSSLGVPLISPMGFGPPMVIPKSYFLGERERTKREAKWLWRLVGVAEHRGVNASMEVIEAQTSIAEEVTRKAVEEEADLIVVGRREIPWIERFFKGSISNGIMQSAKCPVLVVTGDKSESQNDLDLDQP